MDSILNGSGPLQPYVLATVWQRLLDNPTNLIKKKKNYPSIIVQYNQITKLLSFLYCGIIPRYRVYFCSPKQSKQRTYKRRCIEGAIEGRKEGTSPIFTSNRRKEAEGVRFLLVYEVRTHLCVFICIYVCFCMYLCV